MTDAEKGVKRLKSDTRGGRREIRIHLEQQEVQHELLSCARVCHAAQGTERERKDAWRKSKESATSGVRNWRNGRA